MNKKKLVPILLLSLLFSQSPSEGITGGPFDNNLVPGTGADGTYSAVLTGQNLTGFATFGIGSYEGFEGNGRFAVFHEGVVHYGTVSGTADLSSKRVAAALLGVAGLPSELTGSSANIGNGAGQALTIRSSAEGAFTAAIRGYPQQLLFEGTGDLATQANTAVVSTPTTTSTTTIIIPARPNVNQDDADQFAESETITTTQTGQPSVARTMTPFKVRGSRTSTRPFTALNSFAALPPLIPSSPTAGATATPAAP